jgi:hypothetical protein
MNYTDNEIKLQWGAIINRYWVLNNAVIFGDVIHDILSDSEYKIELQELFDKMNNEISNFVTSHPEYDNKRPQKLILS